LKRFLKKSGFRNLIIDRVPEASGFDFPLFHHRLHRGLQFFLWNCHPLGEIDEREGSSFKNSKNFFFDIDLGKGERMAIKFRNDQAFSPKKA
jgi:hypothetical protein